MAENRTGRTTPPARGAHSAVSYNDREDDDNILMANENTRAQISDLSDRFEQFSRMTSEVMQDMASYLTTGNNTRDRQEARNTPVNIFDMTPGYRNSDNVCADNRDIYTRSHESGAVLRPDHEQSPPHTTQNRGERVRNNNRDYDVADDEWEHQGPRSGRNPMLAPSNNYTRPASTPVSRPVPWRKTFGAKDDADIEEYLVQFEAYGRASRWDDLTQTASLLSTLEGRAIYIVRDLPPGTCYDVIVAKLRLEWDTLGRKRALRSVFDNRTRTSRETPDEYLRVLQTLVLRGYGHYPRELQEEQLLKRFVAGQPERVRRAVATHAFESANEALNSVIQFEAIPSSIARNDDRRRGEQQPRRTWQRRAEYPDELPDYVQPECPEVYENIPDDTPEGGDSWVDVALGYVDTCEDGTFEEDSIHTILRVTAGGNDSKFVGQCYYCKRNGHGWTRCFKLRDILVKNGMKPYKPTPSPRNAGTTTPKNSVLENTLKIDAKTSN